MKNDKKFMQNAIKRINELQNETIEKSKKVEGSEEFIAQKLKLYDEDERLRVLSNKIYLQEKEITENFLSSKHLKSETSTNA